jgi:hypothetical protein
MTQPPPRGPRGTEWSSLSDESALIPIRQTAKLWVIPSRKHATPRVVSLHCPTCPNPDDSRLVHIEIVGERQTRSRIGQRGGKGAKLRLLLHVTRPQIQEILRSFGDHDNASTLLDILVHKDESDQEAVRPCASSNSA